MTPKEKKSNGKKNPYIKNEERGEKKPEKGRVRACHAPRVHESTNENVGLPFAIVSKNQAPLFPPDLAIVERFQVPRHKKKGI